MEKLMTGASLSEKGKSYKLRSVQKRNPIKRQAIAELIEPTTRL